MRAVAGVVEGATQLLELIERRVAQVAARSRRVALAFIDGEHLDASVWEGVAEDAASPPTGRQIERFAPQWAPLAPRASAARAELAYHLARRCRLAYDEAPRIRSALGLDTEPVRTAYHERFGCPVEGAFAASADGPPDGLTGSPLDRELELGLEWITLEAGELLVKEGDPSDAAYVVVSGRLQAMIERPEAEPRLLYQLGRGELVGELGAITGEPRPATLRAARDSDLLRLPGSLFDRLAAERPAAAVRMFREALVRVQQEAHDQRPRAALTLAVVSESPGLDLPDFCRRLATALATVGPTTHLSSRIVDERLGEGASQATRRDPGFARLGSWLAEEERAKRFALYEADAEPTAWTRSCLHQADRVLTVVAADQEPVGMPIAALFESGATAWRAPRQELVIVSRGDAAGRGAATWLDLTGAATQHHVRLGVPNDVERLARILTGAGYGLVLGSGGARGMAHIGTLRALAEEGIPIDVVGGTSSGSFLAAQVAMGWDYRTILESNRAIVGLGRKLADFTFPMVSFISARRFTQVIAETFGDRLIEDLPTKYFCVSCDLTTATKMVHERGLVRRFVRASCSIPGILPPVSEQGHLLVDGAVVDAIPTGVLKRVLGGGTAIAGDVSQDHFFQGDPAPAEQFTGSQLLWRRLTGRGLDYPNFISLVIRAGEVGGSAARRAAIPLADIYVQPDLGRMGVLDHAPERFEQAVEAGYVAGRAAVAAWRARQEITAAGYGS